MMAQGAAFALQTGLGENCCLLFSSMPKRVDWNRLAGTRSPFFRLILKLCVPETCFQEHSGAVSHFFGGLGA